MTVCRIRAPLLGKMSSGDTFARKADLEDLVCRNVPNSSQSLIYRPVFNLPRDLSLVLKLINVEQQLFPQKRRTGDFRTD